MFSNNYVVILYFCSIFYFFIISTVGLAAYESVVLFFLLLIGLFFLRASFTYGRIEFYFYCSLALLLISAMLHTLKIKNSADANLYLYSFFTVIFNLLFPFLVSLAAFRYRRAKFFMVLVFAILVAVALVQIYFTYYIGDIDFIYENERVKSPLFQGQPRIPSIFVSANNFSVYLCTILAILLFNPYGFKRTTVVGLILIAGILLYFTYVRKSYVLFGLLVIHFFWLKFLSAQDKRFTLVLVSVLLLVLVSALAFVSSISFDGVLSSQTLGSRLFQWSYYLGEVFNVSVFDLIFGNFVLQSSFSQLGYDFVFLDNNFLMSAYFSGILFACSLVAVTISGLRYFIRMFSFSPAWASVGIYSVYAIFWVGFFSNLIDNHEVSVVLFSVFWLSVRNLRIARFSTLNCNSTSLRT